jgi:hypothetical protein
LKIYLVINNMELMLDLRDITIEKYNQNFFSFKIKFFIFHISILKKDDEHFKFVFVHLWIRIYS